ncbi:MAG: formate/nitrite transporter family protein [Oscillospiraceae bacterium]|nr:formate/nitrite transporter family protein [Oscillospiraceae bacterium]
MLKDSVIDGILAGGMVSVGGAVLLSCDNRYAGAVLFAVALLAICLMGFNLYTGKVGFLVNAHGKKELSVTGWGLLGNLLGTLAVGLLIQLALPALAEAAAAACGKRLDQLWYGTLIRGFFCGILMYTAVWIFREKKTVAGIVYCIPVFILAGFEHSIADMFYFALAGLFFTGKSIVFLLLVLVGNSLGGMCIPFLQSLKGGRNA